MENIICLIDRANEINSDVESLSKYGTELVLAADKINSMTPFENVDGNLAINQIADILAKTIIDTAERLFNCVEQNDFDSLYFPTTKIALKSLNLACTEEIKQYCRTRYDKMSYQLLRSPESHYKEEDAILRSIINDINQLVPRTVDNILQIVVKVFAPLKRIHTLSKKNGVYEVNISDEICRAALAKAIPYVNNHPNNTYAIAQTMQLIFYLKGLPLGMSQTHILDENLSTLKLNALMNRFNIPPKELMVNETIVGSQEELEKWNHCRSLKDCKTFICEYPEGMLADYMKDWIIRLEERRKNIRNAILFAVICLAILIVVGILFGFEAVLIIGTISITAWLYSLYLLRRKGSKYSLK